MTTTEMTVSRRQLHQLRRPRRHTDAAADTTCEVCFVAPREGFALEPCGQGRFCESCTNRVAVMDTCPVCRSNITMVMRIFIGVDTWIETMETVENYERVTLRNVGIN